MVDRQHAVAGLHERLVGGVPVEVGADRPAVQQHHRRAAGVGLSAVAQEQLADAVDVERPRRGASRAAAPAGTRAYSSAHRTHASDPAYHQRHGGGDRIRPRQGHGRRAAAARDLVQARAPRPDDAVGPQRRRQDDAAADAGRRGLDRRRRAGVLQGGQGRAARPAPTARPRAVAARLRALGSAGAGGDRAASWRRSSSRWPTAPTTRRRWTATPAPRRGSSTPAATTGATGPWRRCTGSASATTPISTARSRPSPAES